MANPWKLVSAVVKGADHVRLDLPCQDALNTMLITDEGGTHLIAAVSDGAGSARLAEVGSRIATEVAVAWLTEQVPDLEDMSEPHAIAIELLAVVRAALAAEAEDQEAALSDFACTLLIAVVSEQRGLFAQIGDGAIVISHGPERALPNTRPDGTVNAVANPDAPPRDDATPISAPAPTTPPEFRCVFWPAKGEHANETVFVTSTNAARHLEATLIPAPITRLALFSDGLERLALDFAAKTAFPAFFAPFFDAVSALPAGDPAAAATLSMELKSFLDSPRVHDATSDDRALVLATREGP